MKLLFICMACFFALSGVAQQSSTPTLFFNDFNFITHLVNNGLFDEAEYERSRLFDRPGLPPAYRDSVNYLLGNAFYQAGNYRQAKPLFLAVSDEVFFYYKSRYLASLLEAEHGRPDSALCYLAAIAPTTNADLNDLKDFETAGMYLLRKDYTRFDSVASTTQFRHPLLLEEMANLRNYATIDRKIARRSPFLAGTLSALLPGLGKVYAGNNGQALVSFLTCGALGAAATENFLHYGIRHPQTLFFTGLFSIFYIGNIWGSVLSVQIVKLEKQLENKHNILVGLKLPVSKFFN